jgi:hypothetical protein
MIAIGISETTNVLIITRSSLVARRNLFVRVRLCDTWHEIIINDRSARQKHDCFKKFCPNCKGNRETGHLCYMPLSPDMPSSDKVLYVFYDFETTQNTKVTERHHICAKFSLRPTVLYIV